MARMIFKCIYLFITKQRKYETAKVLNNERTKQRKYGTTRVRNNESTKQQKYETAKVQKYETTKVRNNECAKLQNNESVKQRNGDTKQGDCETTRLRNTIRAMRNYEKGNAKERAYKTAKLRKSDAKQRKGDAKQRKGDAKQRDCETTKLRKSEMAL